MNCQFSITPYSWLACFHSFIAESEQSREQWVQAMRNAIGEALSNSEVVEQIWREPSNSFCADCGAPQPDWAAINLCVVICKQCAGWFLSASSFVLLSILYILVLNWTVNVFSVFVGEQQHKLNTYCGKRIFAFFQLMGFAHQNI